MDDGGFRPDLGKSASARRKTTGMAIATLLMVIGLTLSKGTGFLREIFIMMRLGSETIEADAFYLGFNIPDLFFQLLVGGSIQAAITPSLARSIESGDKKNGWRSVSIFISIISMLMLIVSILGTVLSNWVIPLIYFDIAKISPEKVALGAKVSAVLFPQIFFMMLAAFCIGILNAHKKFSSTAFGPTIYNIFVILSIFILGSQTENGVILAAAGVAVSALIYFLWQMYMARSEIRSFHFSLDYKDEGFRGMLRLALPTMLSASIVQINIIIINGFTSEFAEGIVQALNWARTIWMIPYGIFAVAVGSVMLPSLAANFAGKDYSGARALLGKSLRNALFLTIPSAGMLFVLGGDIVPGLFKWGSRYSSSLGTIATLILMGYCVAIVAQTFVFIYNQAFYAIGNTRVPLLIGVLSMVIITGSCAIMKAAGILSSDNVAGPLWLSIAYSFAGTVNAFVLAFLYKRKKDIAPKNMLPFLIRAVICLLFMMLILYTLQTIPIYPQNKITELLWLAIRGGIGLAAYLAAAKAMNMRELRAFTDRFLKRRRS